MKADLKSKTDSLNSLMNGLMGKYSEAKKLVKLEIPQSQWKEFGIDWGFLLSFHRITVSVPEIVDTIKATNYQ